MSQRARIGLAGAALFGPLVAFPTLLRPNLAIGLCIAVVVAFLASKSAAYPLALWGLPGVLIGLMGVNPFPKSSIQVVLVGWLVLGVVLTLLREENALPLRLVISGPVLLTLATAVLMLWRLGVSADQDYGSFKLQLFLAQNVVWLVAGIMVARHRRHLDLWAGAMLITVTLGSLVLLKGLLAGGVEDVLPGRFALVAQSGPISLARGAAAGLLLAVFLLLASPAAWKRIAALAAIPLLAISFVGAGSRGPVVGLAAGLPVLFALTLGDRRSRRRLLLLGVAVVVSVVLVPQLVPGQNVSRALSVLVGGNQDAGGADVSNGRTQLWHDAWQSLGDHPLTGIGTGGFAAQNPIEIYPHNLLLEAGSELGLLGLALVLGTVGLGFVYAGRSWRRSSGEDRQQAALVAAYLTAAVVNAQFSGDFTSNAGVWLGCGLAFGLMLRIAPNSEQQPLKQLRTRWRRRGDAPPEQLEPRPGGRPLPPAPPAPSRPPQRPAPTRSSGTGGTITSPAAGSVLRGEVTVSCTAGGSGSTVGSVVVEWSTDGDAWREIGHAAADQEYDVFLSAPGGSRRHIAVLRSEPRAEQMRATLAAEHGVAPGQIEIRPASGSHWGRNALELRWDTHTLDDGEYLLRTVTSDVTGRQAIGPEIRVVVDNTAPAVQVEGPRPGAVLMGVVEVAARATDDGSGVAVVRFEHGSGNGDWAEAGTVSAAPFKASWNTGVLPEGDYVVRAIALDRAGNESLSKAVPVRVERVVAAVKLEDPGTCLARTVRLRATVRDEKKITAVEFQVARADTFAWQALGSVSQPPFELDVDTGRLEDGNYDFRAVARDRSGGIDASRLVRGRRVDNVAPSVEVFEPSADAVLCGEIPLSARASDHGSGVTSVVFQFSRDGETWRPVVTRSETAGAVYWDTSRVEDGPYRLRAVVGDSAGNLTTSKPIPVSIDNTPPVVSFDAPASGLELGGVVRLDASATDEGSGLIAVRFEWSRDGVAWGELAVSTAPPHGLAWDTTKVADGHYLLRVVARDRAGNNAFGEPIELFVRNTLVFEPVAPPPPEPEPEPEPVAPEPEPEPVRTLLEGATLWQLERLLQQHGAAHERREELETLLYTLRPYARPDGAIPERFWPLVRDSFGELLE